MFITKKLNINACTKDVAGMFSAHNDKTHQQICTGFNRCRGAAQEALQAMEVVDDNGKKIVSLLSLSLVQFFTCFIKYFVGR
jgi:hypothetical protein